MEINLDIGKILFVGIKPKDYYFPEWFLINDSKKINNLKLLLNKIKFEFYSNIDSCLNASIIMHDKLPLIDQVAWDWIITKNSPKLLEGNHLFGLKNSYIFDAKEKLEKI